MAPRKPHMTPLCKLQAKFEEMHGYTAPVGNADDEEWLNANIVKRTMFKRCVDVTIATIVVVSCLRRIHTFV